MPDYLLSRSGLRFSEIKTLFKSDLDLEQGLLLVVMQIVRTVRLNSTA